MNSKVSPKKMCLMMILVFLIVMGRHAKADFTFGEPVNMGPTVNSLSLDKGPSISNDGLTLFFHSGSNRPGGYGQTDLWITERQTTRQTTELVWGTPINLGPNVNSSYHERDPSISADGLSLYFNSNRPGGFGDRDLWVTTRITTDDPWGEPVNLGPTVNSSSFDAGACISADGLSLYFASRRPGGYGADYAFNPAAYSDIWVTTRITKDDPWEEPVNLGPNINSSSWEQDPVLSPDGLVLFFHSERAGKDYIGGIWVTTRATVSDPWGEPIRLGSPVGIEDEEAPAISADGMLLYFVSTWPGGYGHWDIWQAPILPVVDLNGDGIVDSADMCIMVDYWGTDESLCDIGPTPFGDGIVDIQDLIVLTEHLFEEVNDLTLLAHWALDEIEGNIAHDSVGEYDGTLNGEPLWQPEGGMVGGALQFDGIDNYVFTPSFVLLTLYSEFSVFAWVQGGAPGQTIISQILFTKDWLYADPSDGCLMTELRHPAIDDQPLLSQAVITDGQWHRVGLVWDGTYRTLYVDDVEVASDDQESVGVLYGDLNIGAGKNLEPGSFWSGLIDDVRIYNRAVKP